MVWLRVVLIILGFMVAGLLVGLLLSYVILRIKKRPWPSLRKYRGISVAEGQINFVSEARDPLVAFVRSHQKTAVAEENNKAATRANDMLAELVREHQNSPRVEKEIKSTSSDVIVEVETNLAIASRPWTGKLLPFQTSVWDTNCNKLDSLRAEVKEELTQAYIDMRLANNIVWLSREMGRESKDMDEGYITLSTKIAKRLNRVIVLLSSSGN